jgi:hypothetical protein
MISTPRVMHHESRLTFRKPVWDIYPSKIPFPARMIKRSDNPAIFDKYDQVDALAHFDRRATKPRPRKPKSLLD